MPCSRLREHAFWRYLISTQTKAWHTQLDFPVELAQNPAMADSPFDRPVRFKTCRRYNETGHAHALTFSCFQRRQFLTRERTCLWLAEAISVASHKHEFSIWAYVFMPEHVHLLVCPQRDPYDVSKFLGSLKLPVTRKASAYVSRYAPEFLAQMADD